MEGQLVAVSENVANINAMYGHDENSDLSDFSDFA